MDYDKKIAMLGEERTPDFMVKISFPKQTKNPQRLFKVAHDYIVALQSLDTLLLSSIDTSIVPVFMLEEMEVGSLKIWFKQILEATNDEALKTLDWKPQVGNFLVKAKYSLLRRISDTQALPSKRELEAISQEVHAYAEETDVRRFPSYRMLPATEFAHKAKEISCATQPLELDETITYDCDEGSAMITDKYFVSEEDIDKIFVDRRISNMGERILMVKKADFLGSSKWEFRHEKRNMSASIEDKEWLERYQQGKIDIRPGYALNVIVREDIMYSYDGEVVEEQMAVEKVLAVIKPLEQGNLPA